MNNYYTCKIDSVKARALGEQRRLAHKNVNGTKRFFKDEFVEDIVGIKGELAFSKIFGLDIDDGIYISGDGHIDFTIPFSAKPLTIDVKTFRKPYNLLLKVKESTQAADILVLAGLIDDETVRLIGWQKKKIMLTMPTKDFGFGLVNYYQHSSKLRPMEELEYLLSLKESNVCNSAA